MANRFGINIRNHYDLEDQPDVVLRKFIRKLDESTEPFILKTGNNKVFFKTKHEETKWWSPELTLSIESGENGSHVREVIGPNPATFTLSMFGIIGGSVIFFFAIMVALSQINLGLSPKLSFIVAALAILFIVSVYTLIALGRRWAGGQMKRMTDYANSIIR
jgi:hypothetical protein